MSRAVSKQYPHLSHQLKYVPNHWGRLIEQPIFSTLKPLVKSFSSYSNHEWVTGPTNSQGFSKESLGSLCKRFSLEKNSKYVHSFSDCSSIYASNFAHLKCRRCLWNFSPKLEAKCNTHASASGGIPRFYHSGSKSPLERQKSPNVRLYKARELEAVTEAHSNGSSNKHPDPARCVGTPTTSKNDIVNTDFEVQLTLAQKFVRTCPSVVQPYLQLMRIDRPVGTWLLFWPCGWGLALAAGAGNWPDPWLLAIFGCGAMVMRGAGCTINDLWDRDIDSKVVRTRDRPLASGAVQPLDAIIFLGAQLGTGLLVLLQLNWHSILLGSASLGLVCTYPLVKRIWHWPQLVLGLTFNWGVLLGWCAVHGTLPALPLLPLYTAGVFWTLIYDTIYAHQDKSDDLSIGIKSTAIMFGENTRTWLGAFGACMVGSLLLTGYAGGLAWPHYAATAVATANIVHQLRHLDIHNRVQCGRQFRHNRHVGLIVFLGLVGGSLLGQGPDPLEYSEPQLWVTSDSPENRLLLRE